MKKLTPRTWTFIFAGVGLLALVLLAISLNGLRLSPGQPVSFETLMPDVTGGTAISSLPGFFSAAFRVLMILLWISVPIFIILLIIDKEARKRFLRDLAIIVPLLLLLLFLSNHKTAQQAAEDLNPRVFAAPTLEAGQMNNAPPPPAFVPPPSWVTTATTVAIAAASALIVTGVLLTIWRRWKNQRQLQEPLVQVERQAQAALNAIYAGGDLRETIMRCYLQMVEALKEYRGIHRTYDMTPHEFELFLEKRGLPGEPVRQLTQLFEQVRYGAVNPGRQDERTAVASLTAIISACQKTRPA